MRTKYFYGYNIVAAGFAIQAVSIGGVSMLGRITIGTMNDRIGGTRSLILCFIILVGIILIATLRPPVRDTGSN